MTKTNRDNAILSKFGFLFEKNSPHTARTIMLEDLCLLLECVNDPLSSKDNYLKAIRDDNCLGKRSGKTRILTGKHLVELYSLDTSVTIFRVFRYFWTRDHKGQPLLALLCAYARDDLLRISAPFIEKFSENEVVSRDELENHIEEIFPDRFSKATLKSTAQNLNSSWTKAGHLKGKAKKVRSKASATSGSAAYALFLGYLTGARGEQLFNTEFTRLLDCSPENVIELAEDASRRGWITFKRVGGVMEVLFPNLLTKEEEEWIYEQN
jgi:hypothetical protein